MTGDIKIIHRYLPPEVGELVVWYLWLALPFIERIEALVWQKKAMSDDMWPADASGQQWNTDRMKRELQVVGERGLGQAIHVAAYREIAIAISRQWSVVRRRFSRTKTGRASTPRSRTSTAPPPTSKRRVRRRSPG